MGMVKTILEILDTTSGQRGVKPFSNKFLYFVILKLSPTENFGVGVIPQILDANCYKLYFHFSLNFLLQETFLLMNEL